MLRIFHKLNVWISKFLMYALYPSILGIFLDWHFHQQLLTAIVFCVFLLGIWLAVERFNAAPDVKAKLEGWNSKPVQERRGS